MLLLLPIGFFYDIDKDPNSIFKKLSLHYTVGLEKIYDPAEIDKEKNAPYFQREFCLQYAYGTGNTFIESTIQHAEELSKKYKDTPYNVFTQKAMGIDPGFGSSKTAFVVIEFVNNIIRVLYSKQFEHSSTEQMAEHAYSLMRKYNLNNNQNKVFIDGSQSGFIRSLKLIAGEFPNYDYYIEKANRDKRPLHLYMNIVPVNFSERGKVMLGKIKKICDNNRFAIDTNEHAELLTEMRIAESDEDLRLDKSEYNMDLLDALRLACEFIEY